MNGEFLSSGTKRGSEELMSHSQMVTNGTGMSPQQVENSDTNNDAKKVKLDQNQSSGISRVVHLRGLPAEATEQEVITLGLPFGRITNYLQLKQKNQAFMEFGDEQMADSMVGYYTTNDKPKIRNKEIYVQFSNHKELKTDVSYIHQNTQTQAALQAAQAIMVPHNDLNMNLNKTILRVIIDNMVFQINIDILCRIFSKFGNIQKIITFTKNNTYQSLIQFGDSVGAYTAKRTLDGQNIYNGCCTMRIDFSKLNNLNVKYNNDKSRDLTNPSLPTGDPNYDQAVYGGSPGVLASPFAAVPGIGTAPLTAYGASPTGAMPVTGFGLAQPPMSAARLGIPAPQSGNCVLLVSNLDESVTPDVLFTLFGVYGDVHRVKILFNKKDNALVQMAEPHQAQLAKTYLDKLKVFGKQVRVAQSKHSIVQMPKEGVPDSGLTRDYTTSSVHRFRKPGSKNCQNIYAPSAVLHLSNIPPTTTEEELCELFEKHGKVTVHKFKFFPKDRKMALIQLDSIEEGTKGLIAMHNYPLNESNHLRVSFSRTSI